MSLSSAQRVIFAGNTALTQTRVTSVKTVQEEPDTTVTISVRKTGDATAYHPVDGARFDLTLPMAEPERRVRWKRSTLPLVWGR